jgi:hypothetical protein
MAPGRKDFIGFVKDAAEPSGDRLAREFLAKDTPNGLYKFFQKEGYTDIKEKPDCELILTARKNLANSRIPDIGVDPCPDPRKGY